MVSQSAMRKRTAEPARVCARRTTNTSTVVIANPSSVQAARLTTRLQCGLRRRHARDRHAERRTAHVVESQLVEEEHRRGITAVLAADADLESGLRAPALFGRESHELAYAGNVEGFEGIVLQHVRVEVRAQELGRVVAAETEGHLGQIVG